MRLTPGNVNSPRIAVTADGVTVQGNDEGTCLNRGTGHRVRYNVADGNTTNGITGSWPTRR